MENNIGERIVGLRKKKGLTQLQLAEKLNISDKAVSKWESGKGDPSVEMLDLLSELFDCSLDYLVKGKDKVKIVKEVVVKENVETDEKLSYAQEVWNKVLKIVETKISALSFDVWISNLTPVVIEPSFLENKFCIVLSVPSIASKNVIVKKYEKMILSALKQVNPDIHMISYKIEDIFSDPYFKTAVRLAIINKGVSVSFIQRKLSLGYSRAAQIVDGMEDMKFVSSINGRKLRDVYIDEKKYEEVFDEPFDDEDSN